MEETGCSWNEALGGGFRLCKFCWRQRYSNSICSYMDTHVCLCMVYEFWLRSRKKVKEKSQWKKKKRNKREWKERTDVETKKKNTDEWIVLLVMSVAFCTTTKRDRLSFLFGIAIMGLARDLTLKKDEESVFLLLSLLCFFFFSLSILKVQTWLSLRDMGGCRRTP